MSRNETKIKEEENPRALTKRIILSCGQRMLPRQIIIGFLSGEPLSRIYERTSTDTTDRNLDPANSSPKRKCMDGSERAPYKFVPP